LILTSILAIIYLAHDSPANMFENSFAFLSILSPLSRR
jgi:hypothetical protein